MKELIRPDRLQCTVGVVAVLVLALSGCDNLPTHHDPPQDLVQQANNVVQPEFRRLDDEWADLSGGAVPGFAGHYFSDDGTHVVLGTSPDTRGMAEEYVRELYATLGTAMPAFEYRIVDFDAARLLSWHDRLLPLASRGLVSFLDVDEVTNRVAVGIPPGTNSAHILQHVASLGVPLSAVTLRPGMFNTPDNTLRTAQPVVEGGLRITGPCTAGFNVMWGEVRGFITASHCSHVPFGLDNGAFGQPVHSRRVGVEVFDVALSGPTLPSWGSVQFKCPNYNCRWSDSQITMFDDTVASNQGQVARPQTYGVGVAGSITLSTTLPRWNVINKFGPGIMYVGMWVDKVGQASGWTRGQITRTCSTEVFQANGQTWVLACQNVASYFRDVAGGDSGAPVLFISNADPMVITSVHAAGIHVGGSAANVSVFSPMRNIEFELGTIKVCDWANPC